MPAGVSISAFVSVVFIFLLAACMGMVYYFAEKDFPKVTYVSTTMGYFCTFALLMLVPIDVAVCVLDRRDNANHTYNGDTETMTDLYNSVFVPILMLSNVFLVFEEYYNTDGYFTTGGKISNSCLRMMKDMAFGMVAGVIILSILVGEKILPFNGEAIQLAAVIVTNTVYETMLMFLLGFGLISYPRSLWDSSSIQFSKLRTEMIASSEFKKLSDASLEVSLVVSDVMKTRKQLEAHGDQKLVEAMNILVKDCPPEFKSSTMGKVAVNKSGQVTIDTLAELRTRLMVHKDQFRMAQGRVEGAKLLAYHLEDLLNAQNRDDGVERIFWSLRNKESTREEYLWYLFRKPFLYKAAAVLAALLSIFSFLGVIGSMHGTGESVSIYFLTVHSKHSSGSGIVVFILFTLVYTAYVALWAILQVKVAGLMELVPGRTTPASMSFNVRMCARLAAPLAFFYLGWIRENGVSSGSWTESENGVYEMTSSFSQIYQISVVPILGDTFGTLFPILLFCVAFLFVTNLLNRILVLVKMADWQFGSEIITEEQLREGRRQLQRHKKGMERAVQRREGLSSHLLSIAKAATGNNEHGSPGFFELLFGKKKQEDVREVEAGAATCTPEGPKLTLPPMLKGIFELRKDNSSFHVMDSPWKTVYYVIEPPGEIYFYKDAVSCSSGTNPTHDAVFLSLVMNFTIEQKKGKDHGYLDLEIPDEIVKLRFKSHDDMLVFRTAAIQWKDYSIDYANMYSGVAYVDSPECPDNLETGRASSSAVIKSIQSKAKNIRSAAPVDDEEEEEDFRNSSSTGLLQNVSQMNKSAPFSDNKKKGVSMFGSAKTNNRHELIPSGPSYVDDSLDRKPDPLSGWLDKKSAAKTLGKDWQKRFCRIDEATRSFVYGKTENSSATEKNSGSIDMLLVIEVVGYGDDERTSTVSSSSTSKKRSDDCRFNIDLGERVFKFRASSPQECQMWIEHLNDWREYLLLHMGQDS